MNQVDIYHTITDRIVSTIERGELPAWRRPWSCNAANTPRNAMTGVPYKGVNVWLLASAGYSDPRWMTLRQANELGGHVRRGEKGSLIVFWKWPDAKPVDDDQQPGRKSTPPLLKYHFVFNAAQIEGLSLPPLEEVRATDEEAVQRAAAVVAGYHDGPKICYGYDQAAYSPELDRVMMPEPPRFETPERYYNTLFHELSHSTGHSTRLSRPGITDVDRFGSERYSKEELIAEMSACFLCGAAGIEAGLDQSAAYLQGWLKPLQADPRLIVHAAGAAQRAADYVINSSSRIAGQPALEEAA